MTGKRSILIVEDDPLVAEVIAAALEDGYLTTAVATVREARALLRRGRFRLMLLDCSLPGAVDTGLIGEADANGAAVVLMPGDPAQMDALTGQSRPFVLKPFTLARLLDTVERVLASATPPGP